MKKLLSLLNTPSRKLFLVLVIFLFVLWVSVQILSIINPQDNIQNEPQEEVMTVDQYPDAFEFVNNYFEQIQRGNYSVLVENYWFESVPNEISQSCADPIAEEQKSVEYLWQKCAYFREINVDIVSITETEAGYDVIIQFTGRDGKIIGVDLHPEYLQGHSLKIQNTTDGLKTSDWQFITL